MADILIVDDEESIVAAFGQFLRDEGHEFRIASNADDAIALIEQRPPALAIMDVRMPGRDGLTALREIRSRFPGVFVVIMTAYGTSQTSIDAIRIGAFDYLTKPLDLDEVRTVIGKALAAQRARDEAETAATADTRVPSEVRLVGDTPAVQDVYKLIGRLATMDVPALILGERGTGKRLVTLTIHENSERASRPFVAVDCDSTPEPLLESAISRADAGTLYVGTVEKLPPLLQASLTRLLTVDGSPRVPGAAVPRVFASSEADPIEHVRSGALSRELYDALSVITIRMPPLRERRDDIPPLVRYFIQRFNEELNRTIKRTDDEVLRRLQEHRWAGNVGELERVIKRACIVARSDVITIDDVAASLTGARFDRRDVESTLARSARTALHERLVERSGDRSAAPFHDIIDLVESTLVDEALTITNGNQVKAAEILGVNRATLRKKMPDA